MAQCPFADWRPISVNYRAGGMQDIRGFVPHCQVGNGSLHDFFNNPASQVSAHFWISKTGSLEQYLDTSDMAWAEAAGNPYFWSCEFEGLVDEPMTSQQLDTGGRLIAWLYNLSHFPLTVNESPDGQGITPHYAGGAAWGGHSCPGPTRFQQFQELILAALRYLDPPEDEMTLDEFKSYMNDNYFNGGALHQMAADITATVLGQTQHFQSLTDADLTAVAKAVADEQARRLAAAH